MRVPMALLFVGRDAQRSEILASKAAQKISLARMVEASLVRTRWGHTNCDRSPLVCALSAVQDTWR